MRRGATGPNAHFRGADLTVANAGGWATLTPGSNPDPDRPPLKVFGEQCGLMTGIAGAMVALATLRQARASGVGDTID